MSSTIFIVRRLGTGCTNNLLLSNESQHHSSRDFEGANTFLANGTGATMTTELWSRISPTWKFLFFFNLSKIYSTELFIISHVSSSIGKKKIFRKKTWGHWIRF